MPDLALSVLTWNIYLGADVSRVIAVDPAALPARVAKVWEIVNKTNFYIRAKAIAAAICREQPDVVALQEVCRWSTLYRLPLDQEWRPEIVEYDFLRILLNELQVCGENYFPAVRSPGVDVLLPAAHGPDIRFEDSLVLLLRTGNPGNAKLTWAKPRTGRFSTNLRTTLDGEPFEIKRGWVSVDLHRGDHAVRVINTHLEFFSAAVQPAQLTEVLNGPAKFSGPVILTGDFNAHPGSPTWSTLANCGYKDAWEAAGAGPGYTSGRDEDLRDSHPALKVRIDWTMCRGPIQVLQASLVGVDLSDRTLGGMWPSDHAGLCTKVSVGLTHSPTGLDKRTEPVEIAA
jgi:endonuclease/exonuclease/phosphatase family metal-dependent hydrolase